MGPCPLRGVRKLKRAFRTLISRRSALFRTKISIGSSSFRSLFVVNWQLEWSFEIFGETIGLVFEMVLRVLWLCSLAIIVIEQSAQALPTPDFAVRLAHAPNRFDQTVSNSLVVPIVVGMVFSGDGSFAMKTFCAGGAIRWCRKRLPMNGLRLTSDVFARGGRKKSPPRTNENHATNCRTMTSDTKSVLLESIVSCASIARQLRVGAQKVAAQDERPSRNLFPNNAFSQKSVRIELRLSCA